MVFMIIILIMHKAIVNNFVIIGIITFNFTTFFSPRLFEGHTLFYTALLFLHGSYIRVVLYIVEIMKVCIFLQKNIEQNQPHSAFMVPWQYRLQAKNCLTYHPFFLLSSSFY